MSFVFVPSPPSDKARRLARHLTAAIESFERENPTISNTEIQQALGLVRSSSTDASRILVMVGALLVLALGLGVAFLFTHR